MFLLLLKQTSYFQVVRGLHDRSPPDADKCSRGFESVSEHRLCDIDLCSHLSFRARVPAILQSLHFGVLVRAPLADSDGGSLSTSLGLGDGVRRG